MGERTSVLQTAQPRRFQPPVTSTATPNCHRWGDPFARGFRGALKSLACVSNVERHHPGIMGWPEWRYVSKSKDVIAHKAFHRRHVLHQSIRRRTSRYFKEDHLTGAKYIALATDGSYTVTGVEHMGISVEESGKWSKSDTRITFAPNKAGKPPYCAADVKYRSQKFLSFEGGAGASIAVPVKETESDLDQHPKTLPPYVFFEISATVYQRETTLNYPFRTRPDLR
jgi:hypothetical protein